MRFELKLKLNILAFMCFFLGVSAVQISYILGGVRPLDLGVLLLIPSFLFFILWLLQEWTSESKDYCVGLTILAWAVIIALLSKYRYEVGTIDDSYHTLKVVAYSIQNSFLSKFQASGGSEAGKCLIDFVEDIWGLAWRYVHWDYIIVLIQILPVFVLWRQLVEFFRNRKVEAAGFLSSAIILNMQLIWAQACSTFIDSLTGIIAALTLFKIADLLGCPQERRWDKIAMTALLSAFCLLPKPSLLFLAIFGFGVSFWYALISLDKKKNFGIFLILIPSLGFCVRHYWGVYLRHATFLYPWVGNAKPGSRASLIPYYPGKHFIKPVYIFLSWIHDYKLGFVTPSPTADVGNGLLWTYWVVPILFIALITSVINIRKIKGFRPSFFLLVFFVLFYYFIDGSVVGRYMLGFNIFIMAWAFAWAIAFIKRKGWRIALWIKMAAGCAILAMALMGFFRATKGALLEPRVVSILEAQKELFPEYISPITFQTKYCTMILDADRDKPLSSSESYLVAKCQELENPYPKDRQLSIKDYHFNDVRRNYLGIGFAYWAIMKFQFEGMNSIKGTILDPDNKNGVWMDVSSISVCLRPYTHVTKDTVRKIAGKDFDQMWGMLQEAGN